MTDTPQAILEALEDILKKNSKTLFAKWQKELGGAETEAARDAKVVPPTIRDAAEVVVNNKPSNKYIFSIVLTACLKKMMDLKQDVRIAQDNMAGGYSNRSLDQRVVTPFLKRYGYTHCEASGLESGRNLERPLPWNLEYPCNPRGIGNREAFLGLLNYIEEQGGDPRTLALYMLHYDREQSASTVTAESAPLETNIAQIMTVFTRHFAEAFGQGRSRLPVLALYAIYLRLIEELSRYKEAELLALERHTTADLRSGSIGDLQVNKGEQPFEGVEVKSDKPVTAAMVNEVHRKVGSGTVARYYILSTSNPNVLPEDEEAVREAVEAAQTATGAQIIVNGLVRTLWYYLRLLDDPSTVLPNYKELLDTDPDVRPELQNSWNRILKEEYGSK